MIGLYASIFASSLFRGERIRHTADQRRLLHIIAFDLSGGRRLMRLVSGGACFVLIGKSGCTPRFLQAAYSAGKEYGTPQIA
jgi:hypothetical protein